eukprot:GFYU01013989.1.p1 GENE.GFYU01013989.1~~GFYU01013989.1.p1  ORF type:complete len:536 (+),score=183.51 GFYU01013989.1:53-1660(+)
MMRRWISVTLVVGLIALMAAPSAEGASFGLHRLYFDKLFKLSPVADASTSKDSWFTQRLNPFDPSHNVTFNQRYFLNDQFFRPGGPIFLYVSGAHPLPSAVMRMGYFFEQAKKEKALMVGLEHRFYGGSIPVTELNVDNLRKLNSRLALTDIAYFVQQMSTQFKAKNITGQWHTFGETYGGTLAAWSRLKYPHLIASSFASSAPLRAELAVAEYDVQVAKQAGEKCAAKMAEANLHLTNLMGKPASDALLAKEQFACPTTMQSTTFLWAVANLGAYNVLYGDKTNFCKELTASNNVTSTVEIYAKYAKKVYGEVEVNCTYFDLYAANKTKAEAKSYARQWLWQSCTEFGWFPVAPASNPLRSSLLTASWFTSVCKDVFGKPLTPRVDTVNMNYGGANIKNTKAVFVIHASDPWNSLNAASNPNITVLNVNMTAGPAVEMAPLESIANKAPVEEIRRKASTNVAYNVGSATKAQTPSSPQSTEETTTYYSVRTVIIIAICCGLFCVLLGLLLANLICRRNKREDTDYDQLSDHNLH